MIRSATLLPKQTRYQAALRPVQGFLRFSTLRRKRERSVLGGTERQLWGVLVKNSPKWCFAFVLAGAPLAASAADPVRAVDGDTLSLRIRLENVSAPEVGKRAKCRAERELGEQAASAAAAWLEANAHQLVIVVSKLDRYGRPVARVSAEGEDLGEHLMARGLARSWETGPHDWCG